MKTNTFKFKQIKDLKETIYMIKVLIEIDINWLELYICEKNKKTFWSHFSSTTVFTCFAKTDKYSSIKINAHNWVFP